MSDQKNLVVRPTTTTQEILDKALGRDREPRTTVDDAQNALPTDVRRIRRGKFFLSNYEQEQFGSVFRPIFEYYCHGAVVGETVPDPDKEGIWCYAAHNDFEMVPEFQPPSSWPEYVRTHTGWIRADQKRSEQSKERIEFLLKRVQEIKRLL